MKRSRSVLILTALVLVISALPLAGLAQDIHPDDREFWEAYQKSKELGEDQEISRLVRRSKKEVAGVLESLTNRLCNAEKPEDLEDYRILAEQMATVGGTKKYVHRLEFLLSVPLEKRGDRILASNNYYYGNVKFNEGKSQDNIYTLAEARDFYTKAIVGFEGIGDVEQISEVAGRLAQCLQAMKDHYEACKAFKKALDAMDQLPYPHPDRKWAKHEYDKYIEKGYDPTKPRDEGGQPAVVDDEPEGDEGGGAGEAGGEAGEGEAQPGEGQEFGFKEVGQKETAPLKYAAMKKPDEFMTPTFYASEQPYIWAQAHLQGEGRTQFKPEGEVCPINIYGRQVNVLRDKLKLTFDIDADAKTELTLTIKEKPTKIEFKTQELGPDGKPLKYQLFICHPGSQEIKFSLDTNLTPTDEWMVVRSRIGCYSKGKVAGENFVLIDDNTSGVYGDHFYYPRDGITNGDYTYYRYDAVLVGRSKKAVPYSQIMQIGEKFYKIEAHRFGYEVSATEVEVPTGTVRVDWKGGTEPLYLIIHGVDRLGTHNFFDVMGEGKDPVTVPAGQYEIAGGKIVAGKKNRVQLIRIYRGDFENFTVKPGEEKVLELGAPFEYRWEASQFGQDFVVRGKSINVFGRSGELYTLFWDDVPEPLVSVRVKETKRSVLKNEPMPKPTIDDWYKDQYCTWHPMDLKVENKKGEELEVRLETKKHKVLGGPIIGEWR